MTIAITLLWTLGTVQVLCKVQLSAHMFPGWEANEVRWVGLRIMSGANTD